MRRIATKILSFQLVLNLIFPFYSLNTYAEEVTTIDSDKRIEENSKEENKIEESNEKNEISDKKNSNTSENIELSSDIPVISASAIPRHQYIPLGGKISNNPNQLVDSVSVPGFPQARPISVEFIDDIPKMDIVGDYSVSARVTIEYRSVDGQERTFADTTIPISTIWGNSLYFRGSNDVSIGTYTYIPEEQKIVSNPGTSITPGNVHVDFPTDSLYYSFSQYRLTEDKQLFEETTKKSSHQVTAGMQRMDAVTSFGSGSQAIFTEIGDIIEVYHREPGQRLQSVNDEIFSNVTMRDNFTYFELTTEGYKQLSFDRVKNKESSIIISTTNDELSSSITKYLDLSDAPGVEIVGFVSFPDTTRQGKTTGTIRVQEKLSTGRYVQKDYIVAFNVTRPIDTNIGNIIVFRSPQGGYMATMLTISSSKLRASSPGIFDMAYDGKLLYSMDIYRIKNTKEKLSNENNIFSFEALGNRRNTTINDQFNANTPIIENGDILEVYHINEQRMIQGAGNTILPMRNNRAYLELSNNSYHLLQINQATVSTGIINTETTDDELNENIKDYLNLDSVPNVELVGFITYPDRSIVGNSNGIIRVQESLTNGKFIQYDYTVPFEVKTAFDFEIIPQKLTLAQDMSAVNLYDTIRNVTYNGQVLNTSEYEISVVTEPNTNQASNQIAELLIRNKVTNQSINYEVPITVLWGDTILFRGENNGSVGAYTFHPKQKMITARWGKYNSSSVVNEGFLSEIYYTLDFYSVSEMNPVIDKATPYHSFQVYGEDPPSRFAEFSPSRQLAVSIGDIVKVTHAEAGNRLRYISDEVETELVHNDNTAYLELTDKGYHLLQINQANTCSGIISSTKTNEELDADILEYIDISQSPNLEVVGFVSYPDRTVAGNVQGIIRVQEKLSTGKYIQKDYNVDFTVEYGDLRFLEVPSNFNFGHSNRYSLLHQWLPVENLIKNNVVTVFDGREKQTDWSISMKASRLKNSKSGSPIIGARYNFLFESGKRGNILADGESSSSVTREEVSSIKGQTATIGLEQVKLFLPRLSGVSSSEYEGEITWTIDLVP
ncbi:TPA: hypothetical protein ACN1M8_002233 [Enterococcus faecium]